MDIQTVLDRAEIADLLALYCRGLDRRDEATLRSIYHDDAVEDRGEGLFVGPAQDWVAWTLEVLPVFAITQHCILNSLIDIAGDTARGETYFNAYHRFEEVETAKKSGIPEDISWPEGGTELILAGRYLDRFERRNGRWKIAYRKMVCDWCRTQPVADEWFSSNPTAYRGIPDIADAGLAS
jgi:hypothetical protein